jgi:hypothetical protein
MVIAADWLTEGCSLSRTVAVKLELPLLVGFPAMMPVEAANESPLGRLPDVIDQVYAGVPPVACNDCE